MRASRTGLEMGRRIERADTERVQVVGELSAFLKAESTAKLNAIRRSWWSKCCQFRHCFVLAMASDERVSLDTGNTHDAMHAACLDRRSLVPVQDDQAFCALNLQSGISADHRLVRNAVDGLGVAEWFEAE